MLKAAIHLHFSWYIRVYSEGIWEIIQLNVMNYLCCVNHTSQSKQWKTPQGDWGGDKTKTEKDRRIGIECSRAVKALCVVCNELPQNSPPPGQPSNDQCTSPNGYHEDPFWIVKEICILNARLAEMACIYAFALPAKLIAAMITT